MPPYSANYWELTKVDCNTVAINKILLTTKTKSFLYMSLISCYLEFKISIVRLQSYRNSERC